MPEGDTIFKLARAIAPDLEGERLEEVWLREAGRVAGHEGLEARAVRSMGKHLLIGLGPDWTLRTHLGLDGDLHRYPRGMAWARPRTAAVAVLATAANELVWYEPAEAELFRTADLARHPRLSRLGPDLLGERLDVDAVIRRAHDVAGDRAIAEVLLDQKVAAGIGNVYKSEVLFIAGVSPTRLARELTETDIAGLYLTARVMMQRNLKPGPRTTRLDPRAPGRRRPDEPRLWVYGRHGRPCLVCGATVRLTSQGDQARATYFCPSCQG